MSRNPTPRVGGHHFPSITIFGGRAHLDDSITNIFDEKDTVTKILRSLQGIPERDRIMARKGQRTTDTCEWLMRSQEYLNWRNDDSVRILGVSGGPGRGKTMLALEQLRSAKR